MDQEDFLINTIWGLTTWNIMVGGIMFWQWYASIVL